jgi:type II secretory pathway pseudopilin PulG
MKLHESQPASRRGLTLIELLIYISVLLTVSAVSFSAVMRLWSATGNLSAATDENGAALRAAEQWRADIRAASGPVVLSENGMRCVIPTTNGTITWTHSLEALWRQLDSHPGSLWVPRVQICSFEADPRIHTTPVRCDLLLIPRSTKATQAPTFTFLAVPPSSTQTTP